MTTLATPVSRPAAGAIALWVVQILAAGMSIATTSIAIVRRPR